MGNPIYDPLPCSNKWAEQLHDTFWSEKQSRSKARSHRSLEQRNKKSHVEEGFNTGDRKYKEEPTSDVIIPMDTDGFSVDPYNEVIPPYIVPTYASDDDSNRKSDSDSNYEPEDDDENVLGEKVLPGGTYI